MKFLLTATFLLFISCSDKTDNKAPSQSLYGDASMGMMSAITADSESQAGNDPEAKPEVLKLNGAQATRVVLKNGLKAILISSPTSRMASGSLAVQVGFRDDPVHAQGLAHYLEHMLFLGNKEYPEPNSFQEFLRGYGGGSNATTSFDTTNYFFSIPGPVFPESLQRFSRFFVSPLFTPEYSEKEKSAVHNEFNRSIVQRKANRANSALISGKAYRTFGTGNLDTLANVQPEDSRKLFQEKYYAEAMQLVLAGPQSLSELESLATEHFSDIQSHPDRPLNSYPKLVTYNKS